MGGMSGFLGLLFVAAAAGLLGGLLAPRLRGLRRYLVVEASAPPPPAPEAEAATAAEARAALRLPAFVQPLIGLAIVLVLAAFVSAQPRTAAPPAANPPASQPRGGALPPLQLPEPRALPVLAALGSGGQGPAQLEDPRDIALDPAGNIYVADDGNHRVLKLTPAGAFVAAWTDTPRGKLVEPVAVAAASDGLIVLDNATGQAHKLSFDGAPLAGFEHDAGLFRPRGVAVAPNGTIYIADTGRNRLVRLTADGAPDGEITAQGELDQPVAVAFDGNGNVFVAEPDANRIDKLAPDGSVVGRWATAANSTVLPPHLLWSAQLGLIVTQPEQQQLAVYSADGQLQETWTAAAAGGASLQRPLGLALAADRQSIWLVSNGANQLLRVSLNG